MSVNKVNSDGSLSRIAGGTLYADAPIGSIMSYGGTTAPSGWLLCDGRDTTGTTEELFIKYPALYTYLGNSNILPAQFDHSKLSDWENIILPTSAATAITMDCDGIITTTFASTAGGGAFMFLIYINGIGFCGGSGGSGNTGDTVAVPFKKGDKVYVYADGQASYKNYAAYYRQPLCIKAKQVSVPFDVAEYIRNQNILSDYESITLPVSSIPYDGLLTVSVSNGGYVTFSINGRDFTIGSTSGTSDTSDITLAKGDNVGFLAAIGTYIIYARYYKLRDYTGR